jgi:hypothetical protein
MCFQRNAGRIKGASFRLVEPKTGGLRLPMGLLKEDVMRKVLIPLGLAAGMVAGVSANAGAIAIGAAGMKEAATVSSPLAQVQYSEHRTRHGHTVKCYREFVIGPYRCHWFPL